MEAVQSSAAEKLLSSLVMLWAIGWVARYRIVASGDQVALGVTGLLAAGGVLASVAVWRAKPSALRTYASWAIADVIGLVVLDARVESVWWKVVLGAVAAAAVLGIVGFCLAAASRRRDLEPGVTR